MSYAVMGITLERVESIKQREHDRLAKKAYVYEQTDEGKRRVDLIPGVRERVLAERTQQALAEIKPKVIEEFSAPQFARDWIELAKKTNAPFTDLFVAAYVSDGCWQEYKVGAV